jgi:hypothetical protein
MILKPVMRFGRREGHFLVHHPVNLLSSKMHDDFSNKNHLKNPCSFCYIPMRENSQIFLLDSNLS